MYVYKRLLSPGVLKNQYPENIIGLRLIVRKIIEPRRIVLEDIHINRHIWQKKLRCEEGV